MEAIHINDGLEDANCNCLNAKPQDTTCKDVDLEACNPMNQTQGCNLSICNHDFVAPDNETPAEEAQTNVEEDITPKDAAAIIETNCLKDDLVILDVSTKREHRKWHLENAVNINFFSMKFRQKLEKLDEEKTYLVYCKMGCRSKMAQKMMKHIGFKNVYNIAGGRDRWQAEGLPVGPKVSGAVKTLFLPIILPIVFVAADIANSCLTWLQA